MLQAITRSLSWPATGTRSGSAYTFQIPGPLAEQDNVAIPLKIQNTASTRCVYAYLQQGTSDGQSAYVVKYSTDGGATWNVLEKMGIAQSLPTAFKNTWDCLVGQGYGKPEKRRLPYDDYGLVTIAAITGSGVAQAVATTSYDGSTSGLVPGDFVFLEFGLTNEERVNVNLGGHGEPDLYRHRDQEPSSGIEHPAFDPADRRAARRQRPGVRYQGGGVA